MAKIKVAIVGTVGKSVAIDPKATVGSQLGVDFLLPDGSVATVDSLAELLGVGGEGSDGDGVRDHRLLRGLRLGDDHPQYTQWVQNETITGHWTYQNQVTVAIGGVEQWNIDASRVQQTIPLIINVATAASTAVDAIQINNVYSGGGIVLRTVSADAGANTSNQLGFWEAAGRPPSGAGYGFRWLHDGAPSESGDIIFYSHNNSASGTEIYRHRRQLAQMLFVAGSVAAPTIALGDFGTGFYQPAANQIAAAISGSVRLTLTTTVLTSALTNRAIDGSAGTPSWSFTSDPDTGAYRAGPDQYGVTTGGSNRLLVSTTSFTATLPWQGPAGSAASPTFSTSGDPNTGAYSGGADIWAIATAGVERVRVGAAGQIGLGGANYGTAGQVLTSNGASLAPTWEDGGGGMWLEPVSNGDPDNPEPLFVDGDFVFVERELL